MFPDHLAHEWAMISRIFLALSNSPRRSLTLNCKSSGGTCILNPCQSTTSSFPAATGPKSLGSGLSTEGSTSPTHSILERLNALPNHLATQPSDCCRGSTSQSCSHSASL